MKKLRCLFTTLFEKTLNGSMASEAWRSFKSDQLPFYNKRAKRLLETGSAYVCICHQEGSIDYIKRFAMNIVEKVEISGEASARLANEGKIKKFRGVLD